ncbi:uncharacterized protein LOC127252618 isoform X2 [Andrographis paniculata]|uniref:uncharacterized protein LOC127252618 isoform X2 n=1 Tax=Andrographis paniculata TaxID=175694 RepID=UPI0021E95AC3|nr:uncharacterized protein LOC127252618 isoform X2 [Andrographis paniculata]
MIYHPSPSVPSDVAWRPMTPVKAPPCGTPSSFILLFLFLALSINQINHFFPFSRILSIFLKAAARLPNMEEGSYRSEAVRFGRADVLLDLSDLESVQSCGDIAHCEEKDDNINWTDEKHCLYLEHLEVSFVKQLHQSMGLGEHSPGKNNKGNSSSQFQMRSVSSFNTTSEQQGQGGCCEVIIDHKRCTNIFSHGLRTFDVAELIILDTEKHEKVPAEGTGQNFVNDDDDDERQNKQYNH